MRNNYISVLAKINGKLSVVYTIIIVVVFYDHRLK